jgi:hypothetical protein
VKAFSVGYKARMAAVNCGKKPGAQRSAPSKRNQAQSRRNCDSDDQSVLLTF